MRTIILFIYLFFFFTLSMPLHWILLLVGKKNPKLKLKISNDYVRFAFNVCLFISGAKREVHGLSNIPQDEPVLFVSNHRSYYDILLTHTTIKRPVGYVAKKEMLKIPFLRLWMKDIGCLFLDRDNIKEGLKTVLKGVEYLKSGHSMFICPEGTRSKDGKMAKFKEGSLKMAEKAKCAVIPVAIIGSENLLEARNGFNIKRANTIIAYGKPILLNELDPEDKKHAGAYVQSIISDMYDKYNATYKIK